jgi:hypothetical protein
MARIVRRSRESTEEQTSAETLAIVVGRARVEVGRGFDGALLREVVAALGGTK